jgi:hypothetical protein
MFIAMCASAAKPQPDAIPLAQPPVGPFGCIARRRIELATDRGLPLRRICGAADEAA